MLYVYKVNRSHLHLLFSVAAMVNGAPHLVELARYLVTQIA
jgi:hypothetical protein